MGADCTRGTSKDLLVDSNRQALGSERRHITTTVPHSVGRATRQKSTVVKQQKIYNTKTSCTGKRVRSREKSYTLPPSHHIHKHIRKFSYTHNGSSPELRNSCTAAKFFTGGGGGEKKAAWLVLSWGWRLERLWRNLCVMRVIQQLTHSLTRLDLFQAMQLTFLPRVKGQSYDHSRSRFGLISMWAMTPSPVLPLHATKTTIQRNKYIQTKSQMSTNVRINILNSTTCNFV